MIGLAKSALHWYEKTAHKYVKGTLPDRDDPITLDRLWQVCKKYLIGAPIFLFDDRSDHKGYNSTYNSHGPNFYFFVNPFSGSRSSYSSSSNSHTNKDGHSFFIAFLIALAAICLTVLITAWVLSGIAFQHVIRNCVQSTRLLVENAFSGLIGVLGAAAGIAVGAMMGIFSKHKNTYLEFIQAGASIGYNMGSKAGEWFGWFAGIGLSPAAVVLSLPLGIALGLPMGALTLIVAPLYFIKTTYNYINNSFEEKLQSNHNPQHAEIMTKSEKLVVENDQDAADTIKPASPAITNLKDSRAARKNSRDHHEAEGPQAKPQIKARSNSLSST